MRQSLESGGENRSYNNQLSPVTLRTSTSVRSHRGILAFHHPLAKNLSQSRGLRRKRPRATPEFFSNQKLTALEPPKNDQPDRACIRRSQTSNQTHGCHGSHPEHPTHSLRRVSSSK